MSAAANPVEIERSTAKEKARRALELAGRALDPNLGSPDVSLARLLLEQAALACASAGVEEAEIAEVHGDLETEDASALRAVEARLAKILRRPAVVVRTPAARRRRRLAWLVGASLGLCIVVAIPVVRGCSSRGYRFVASSTVAGFSKEGKLGQRGAYGLLFHTKGEKQPWVEVDLEHERPIAAITVVNRGDCCADRAVPLAAEIAGDDRKFREVGLRDEEFESWTVELPPGTTARWLRLVARKKTSLHLQEIHVR